jgi:flavin reductase (DIM6/NTAB) family NADH-FMN oxidoreductase RutF
MSGVTVITTRHGERDHGMTASAFSSLSLDPPMVTVCLHRDAPTQEAVVASGTFAVNILREGDHRLATWFATPHDDKFADVERTYGPLGQPLLDAALVSLECETTETVVGGTHRVFLARVHNAQLRTGAPLAYYRGRFGRLEIADDDRALAALRRAVLSRTTPLGDLLDLTALSEQVQAPPAAVEFALARLLSEGLVQRDDDGYRQVPLDVTRSDEAFEAKLVIDRGAARLATGNASDEEFGRLVELARATAPPAGADLGDEQVEALAEANETFHQAAIALSGNGALVDAYRQLRLPTILTQVMWRDAGSAARLADEHVAIAQALKDRDLHLAQALITAHNEHGRVAHRRAILAAGGRI